MLNQMNKHINHLHMRKLLGMEQKEHGLSKEPSAKAQAAREMKEHKLKNKPTYGEMIMAEEKEHRKGRDMVIGSGYQGRARKSNG